MSDCEEFLEEFKLSLQNHCKKLKRDDIIVHIDNSPVLRGGAERSVAGDGQDIPNDINEET